MSQTCQNYHYLECGLPYVWLHNGVQLHETLDGTVASISDVTGLHRTLATHIARCNQITGREFRFLRMELGMDTHVTAEVLNIASIDIHSWENHNADVPESVAKELCRLYLETSHDTMQLGLPFSIPKTPIELEYSRAQGWQLLFPR